jgi:hypothetical protein
MYFAQVAGEPLRLKFVQATYGPYAENLRHVLATIEGHFVAGYADGGDQPDKRIELIPGIAERSREFLEEHEPSLSRFQSVTDLVEGFETPFGMELLASVHWVAVPGSHDLDAVVGAVHRWSERKRQFTRHHIALAHQRLEDRGWLGRRA